MKCIHYKQYKQNKLKYSKCDILWVPFFEVLQHYHSKINFIYCSKTYLYIFKNSMPCLFPNKLAERLAWAVTELTVHY